MPDLAEAAINLRVSPPVANAELNALFAASWDWHPERDFQAQLERGLTYVCAYAAEQLVGFVYLAWDGGIHAFVLDPTVHPAYRRRGIGRRLVQEAARVAKQRGIVWLHVDYEPELRAFYAACGFAPTEAGIRRLGPG